MFDSGRRQAIFGAFVGAALAVGTAGAINVTVEPDKHDTRQAIPIDKGPKSETISLVTVAPWKIVSSECGSTSDLTLWSKIPNTHNYRMENGYSSQEYVTFTGKLERDQKGGNGGKGVPPQNQQPFTAIVPAVDIDWEGHEDDNFEGRKVDKDTLG